MKTNHWFIRMMVLTATLAAFLLMGSAALAESEFIEMTKMSESQRSIVSQSGVALIETVADARSDIREADYTRGQRELRKARRICHQIVSASPSLSLQNSFKAALDSLGRDKKKYPEQLAPIYRQLNVYKTVADDTAIVADVNSAKGKFEAGEEDAAVAELQTATTKIVYFEVDIPINKAYQLLILASDDFTQGGLDGYLRADQRLREIQDSLKSFATIAEIKVDDAEFADVAAPPPPQ